MSSVSLGFSSPATPTGRSSASRPERSWCSTGVTTAGASMAGPIRRGAFPGSFNPLTLGHLAVAEVARTQCNLGEVDLIVSRVALAKEPVERPRLEDRVAVLRAAAASRPWLGVRVTDDQLIADIAAGYDVVIMGADKWAQVDDPAFYGGSTDARDAAVARLPVVAVAPRPP